MDSQPKTKPSQPSQTVQSATADRDLVIVRDFDAPRELLFTAWSDPRHIDRWFGPRGFTTTTHAMAFRPGGIWHHVMRGPDGREFDNRIRYREITPPARISYEHFGGTLEAPADFEAVVTFTALPTPDGSPARSRLELRMTFPTSALRDQIVRQYGALEGGHQTLARLAEHLAALAGGPAVQEVTLRRTFAAPRALVFAAWTQVEHLRRWWGPLHFTNPVCEFDARPGGAIRIHMRAPDGTVYPMTGTVLELVAPERLVLRCQALDARGQLQLEVINSASFSEEGGRTTVVVHAQVVSVTAEGALHVRGMEQGWSGSLERLAALVQQS